jgi:transposase-like protein
MPQVQLPIFPQGVTPITPELAFQCQDGKVCYFNGHLPVFLHEVDDLATFRMFSSQLVINGNATQAQIARAFGVPLITVKRYVKLYRLRGVRAFFVPPARRAGPKLTPAVCAQAQALLDEGLPVPEVGRRLGLLANTLHKAIRAGRLSANVKKKRFAVAGPQHEKPAQPHRCGRPDGLRHHPQPGAHGRGAGPTGRGAHQL